MSFRLGKKCYQSPEDISNHNLLSFDNRFISFRLSCIVFVGVIGAVAMLLRAQIFLDPRRWITAGSLLRNNSTDLSDGGIL